VWVIAREAPGYATLSLVNLVGVNNTLWNVLHEPPKPQRGIPVTMRASGPVESVVLTTPDADAGRPLALDFQTEGDQITFTVPALDRWDLVIVTYGV